MIADFLWASGHHIALLLMIAVLGAEAVLLRLNASEALLKTLGRLDLLYGIAAGALLLFGIARLGMGAKGFAFYMGNPMFWLKMALFVVIGVISIVPTIRFIRWRRVVSATGQLPSTQQWTSTRKLAMVQLHLLPFVAIAAAAMARGIGS